MNTTNELRNQRARIWEQAKAFLDSHRDKNGILTAEDTETYERMEQDIVNLGKEIDRQERLDAFERELKAPTSEPLTSKPDGAKADMKTGRASEEYRKNFWNALRSKYPLPNVTNALQVGTDSEGGYLVPDEFERTLIEALTEENFFRRIATVIHSNSGDRKIPVVASKGTAGWIDEEGLYPESDDSFGQLSLGAYKLGTMIKISEELLNDSAFDMEGYITREFARRIGTKEEEAFFTGDGTGKPLGLLADTGGAEVGVTTAGGTAITADEIIDLYYSLRVPYRKKAKWIMNDSTVSAHPYAVLLCLLETEQCEYGYKHKEHDHSHLYIRIDRKTVQQQRLVKADFTVMVRITLIIIYLYGVAQAAHVLHATVQVCQCIGLSYLDIKVTLYIAGFINHYDRYGLVACND